MTANKIKVGLIGAGFIGALHAKNLSRHPGIELAYVAEPNSDLGGKVAAEVGSKWIADPAEILSDSSVDAVWIASPASTHTDLIRRSIEANKAVFCEKPVGMDLVEVDALVDKYEDYGKPVFIGFNRRFDGSHARLKEIVESGAIGKVEMVSITSRDPNPPPVYYMKATPGGIFYDTIIHDLDIARWLLGEEPVEVYSTASCHLDNEVNPDREYDAATVTLKCASGAVCQITASRRAVYGYDQRIEVFGSKGMVQSENHGQSNVKLYQQDSIKQDPLQNFFIDRYATAYVSEIDTFVAACRGEKVDFPNLKDGREALFLSFEALKSARSDGPVRLG